MTKMTMKANDTLHLSEVSPHCILADQEFVVSKSTAEDLEKRGLATIVGEAPASEESDAEGEKADPPLHNKMEAVPANKRRGKRQA